MHRPGTLLACALLAAASSLVTSYDDKYMNWLQLPGISTIHRQERQNALRGIGVKEGDQAEVILAKIKSAFNRSPERTREHQLYKELINYASNPPSYTCEPAETYLVLDICSLIHEDSSLASFSPFLLKYGGMKYRACGSWAESSMLFGGSYSTIKPEEELGRFSAALLGHTKPKLKDEVWLLNIVKKVSLLESGDLKLGQAVKLAKKLGYLRLEDPFEIFDRFLKGACLELKNAHGHPLNVVALDIAFNHRSRFYYRRTIKLHEYSRLCMSWTRSDMRSAAVQNIASQFRAPFWKFWHSTEHRAGSSTDPQ